MGVKGQRALKPNPAFALFPAKTPSHKNQNGKLSGDRFPAPTESGRQRDPALLDASLILADNALNSAGGLASRDYETNSPSGVPLAMADSREGRNLPDRGHIAREDPNQIGPAEGLGSRAVIARPHQGTINMTIDLAFAPYTCREIKRGNMEGDIQIKKS